MSQLQEGGEYQTEYETNFGKPIRDPNTGVWTDTDNPGKRIAPPPGRGPHVPKFNPELGLKDTNGMLIPSFVQLLDANYCLDQTKYKNIADVWNILQWEMASSGQKIRELRDEIRHQKNAVKKNKSTHPGKNHHGTAEVDLRTVPYFIPNPDYDKNVHKTIKPNKELTPQQIESRKLKKERQRANKALKARVGQP
jgi:hypothetical protein